MRIFCGFALLGLLGACVPNVNITRDTTLSGRVVAKSFRVGKGVVVSADDDLVVESLGPVDVEGKIRGEIGSGASVEIRASSGDCVIAGEISAGSGADGEEPGENGETGGSVRLRADRGALRVAAALEAGAGGEGAGRRVQGSGDLRVASGSGGDGGDVELAGAVVALGGTVTGGEGGAGGAAFAEVMLLADGEAAVVDRGESRADEEEDGVDDLPMPAAGSANVLARSGGKGGSLLVQAADPRGSVVFSPGAALRAGSGGSVGRASARGGRTALAALERPGAGGDVVLRWSGLTGPSAGWELLPGLGGDAGTLGALSGEARAHESASARTAGGGDGGKLVVGQAPAAFGAGGDSCNVLAQTDADARYDFGDLGAEGAPGRPASVQTP